jgi:hypothetical protein
MYSVSCNVDSPILAFVINIILVQPKSCTLYGLLLVFCLKGA